MLHKTKENDSENSCRFCSHAKLLSDDDIVLCSYKGIVKCSYVCKKYIYDFLKRNPGKIAKIEPLDYIDIHD